MWCLFPTEKWFFVLLIWAKSGGFTDGLPHQMGDLSDQNAGFNFEAITFESQKDLKDMTHNVPLAAFAFVEHDETLLLRVQEGWRYVHMGPRVFVPGKLLPPPSFPDWTRGLPGLDPQAHGLAKALGPSLRLVALNTPLSGNMRGLPRVDHQCYKQARAAGLPGGAFRAFLSSRDQDLKSLVFLKDVNTAVVNLEGDLLFNSWKTMLEAGSSGAFDKRIPILAFNGKNVLHSADWPRKRVWTGTSSRGKLIGNSMCSRWEKGRRSSFGNAGDIFGGRLLLDESFTCDNSFVVLCIEITSRELNKIYI